MGRNPRRTTDFTDLTDPTDRTDPASVSVPSVVHPLAGEVRA